MLKHLQPCKAYFAGGSLAKIESAAEQTAAFALTGFTLITLCRPSNQKHIDVICDLKGELIVCEEEKCSPDDLIFPGGANTWIGLNDIGTEGTFTWADDAALGG